MNTPGEGARLGAERFPKKMRANREDWTDGLPGE